MANEEQTGGEPPWEDSALTCQQAQKLTKLLEVPGDDGRNPDDVFHIRLVESESYRNQVRIALLLLESLEATQTDWLKLVGTRINDVVSSDVLEEWTHIDDKLGPCLADANANIVLTIPYLVKLDTQQAIYLRHFKGTLHLNGLKSISDEAALHLFQCEGTLNVSSLGNLGKEATLQLFSRGREIWCFLPELKEVDVPLAKAIHRNFKNQINLPGISSLTPEVAAILSQSEANLSMKGIKELDVETAKILGCRKGGRLLIGLEQIEPDIAIALSPHHGPVHLPELKTLSTCSAKILSKFNLFPVLPDPFREMVLKENCKLTAQQRLFLYSALRRSIEADKDLVEDLLEALPKLGNDRGNFFPTIESNYLEKLKRLRGIRSCKVNAMILFLEAVGAARGDYICILKNNGTHPMRKMPVSLDTDVSLNPNVLEIMILGQPGSMNVLDHRKSLDSDVAKFSKYIAQCFELLDCPILLRGLEHISKDLASVLRSIKCDILLGSPTMDEEARAILETAPNVRFNNHHGSEV